MGSHSYYQNATEIVGTTRSGKRNMSLTAHALLVGLQKDSNQSSSNYDLLIIMHSKKRNMDIAR
jgi:hypothetical protein